MKLRDYQEQAVDFLYERDRAMILASEWTAVYDVWQYEDGKLFWKIKCGRGCSVKHPGEVAAVKPDSLGYQYVTWKRKHYAVHRVVFLLTQGWLPECVDHIDGNPSNNSADNLRAATRMENVRNSRARKNNTSGVKNVCRHKQNCNWVVRLSFNGKQRSFGAYSDLELADLVATEARNKYFQEFANHA